MKEQLKINGAHPRGNLEVLVKIVLGHPSNNPEIQSFFASKLDQIRSSLLKLENFGVLKDLSKAHHHS